MHTQSVYVFAYVSLSLSIYIYTHTHSRFVLVVVGIRDRIIFSYDLNIDINATRLLLAMSVTIAFIISSIDSIICIPIIIAVVGILHFLKLPCLLRHRSCGVQSCRTNIHVREHIFLTVPLQQLHRLRLYVARRF